MTPNLRSSSRYPGGLQGVPNRVHIPPLIRVVYWSPYRADMTPQEGSRSGRFDDLLGYPQKPVFTVFSKVLKMPKLGLGHIA
jgi:hypothetical protein